MQPAKNTSPGKRSVEGSSSDGAFPTPKMNTGQLTPPGLKSYPKGSPNVEYSAGASTPSDDGLGEGSSCGMTPLSYKKG